MLKLGIEKEVLQTFLPALFFFNAKRGRMITPPLPRHLLKRKRVGLVVDTWATPLDGAKTQTFKPPLRARNVANT